MYCFSTPAAQKWVPEMSMWLGPENSVLLLSHSLLWRLQHPWSGSESSLPHAEIPEDDVQDLLRAPAPYEMGQVSPSHPQGFGCQSQICGP